MANTHRYKPQSCRSPDDGGFPKATRTGMTRKDLQEREPHERVSYLDIKRRIVRKYILRTHTYVTLEPGNYSPHIRTLHSNRHI